MVTLSMGTKKRKFKGDVPRLDTGRIAPSPVGGVTGVVPVIIAELELCNIERHVFLADIVERPDDASFEDRPEALDCIGVDCAEYQAVLSDPKPI